MFEEWAENFNIKCANFLGFQYSKSYSFYNEETLVKKNTGIWYQKKDILYSVFDEKFYYKINDFYVSNYYLNLNFHNDYKLLIDVIEKIESLGYEVNIFRNNVDIVKYPELYHILEITEATKKRAIIKSIEKFIDLFVF